MSDLVERCREILEWSSTGLLHGGSGGALRAYAEQLKSEGIPEVYALQVAQTKTESEAMRELIEVRGLLDDKIRISDHGRRTRTNIPRS